MLWSAVERAAGSTGWLFAAVARSAVPRHIPSRPWQAVGRIKTVLGLNVAAVTCLQCNDKKVVLAASRMCHRVQENMVELVEVLKCGLQQITGHGGLRGLLQVFFRASDIKVGTLVGEDKYRNKYYEDNKQFFDRHRWVVYTTEMNGKNTFWNMDGSMMPPEWHRWLHCMTDDPSTTNLPTPRKCIWASHKFKVTDTPEQYVPYSTTRKKIQEWVPPSTPYK
ncbi:NADH dehydrogenase [ubiquinone] 1 alpha subcomplex subunit 12-like [Acomys russatus]|uniref:NADH dehydrogenase [ubiquinone] 1 alpha subcomplex subunit 12-like n=1 Tax=Acomys russatus TaxID=60746 RepID=UPI0021E2B17F|nr:NADH dehydrogenase [ubiquinone] 1 alpha subcomplex subunit 12-like [Acomys russatus]